MYSDNVAGKPKAMLKEADEPRKFKRAPFRLRRIRIRITRRKVNKICGWVKTAPDGLPGSKSKKLLDCLMKILN